VTPRAVRAVVLVVCASGVAGMIVSSVLDAEGAALTCGLVTAGAVACLIVATAVAGTGTNTGEVDEQRAARVEQLVQDLVAAGADEGAVRQLVQEASRLRSRPTSPPTTRG
jgi:hypothetical protein